MPQDREVPPGPVTDSFFAGQVIQAARSLAKAIEHMEKAGLLESANQARPILRRLDGYFNN